MQINKIDNKATITYLGKNYGTNILPLSIIDNECFPGTLPLEDLFFYKKETSILKLEECLLKTIEHYNLFSSRLIMIDENKFALQYCTDGVVTSILPSINVTSDNINIEDIKKMMVHVKTLPGEPLFAITGIPIKDGILGAVSCSHALCDGIALMLFLYAWGCTIEGKSFPLPSTQRLFKGNPVCSDKIDKAFIPPLSELSDIIQNRVKSGNVKTYTKREYFTDEFLNDIKKKAKSENEKYVISNNQIIISFLLKKYHNQILPDTDKIILRNPINIRDIHPDIDSLYIGNAYFNSFTEFTKDEIDKMSMPQIAYRMKESIANTRNENFIKELSYLSKYGIEFKTDIYEKYYRPFNINTDILSSNLTHLNDLESLGLGSNIGSLLHMSSPNQTSFTMLKEKSDRMFAQITSMCPLT
jgi:hypothetical protein